jgi:hypothetical protein
MHVPGMPDHAFGAEPKFVFFGAIPEKFPAIIGKRQAVRDSRRRRPSMMRASRNV